MSLSAILLIAAPGQAPQVRQALAEQPWAELHQQDDAGRMIVTVEAEDTDQGVVRLKALKALPGVLSAELVIHCYEDERAEPAQPDATLETLNRDDAGLPAPGYLRRLKALGDAG